MAVSDYAISSGLQTHTASLDLDCSAENAFALLCAVEKWPVWLSFLRSARRPRAEEPLEVGSEVVLRSSLPGAEEELYEIDGLITNYRLSLVGAFSCRRRLDFRIEQKSERSKIVVRLDYPTYGGIEAALVDRLTVRRRLDAALGDSLVHFKGLVEYERDGVLADF